MKQYLVRTSLGVADDGSLAESQLERPKLSLVTGPGGSPASARTGDSLSDALDELEEEIRKCIAAGRPVAETSAQPPKANVEGESSQPKAQAAELSEPPAPTDTPTGSPAQQPVARDGPHETTARLESRRRNGAAPPPDKTRKDGDLPSKSGGNDGGRNAGGSGGGGGGGGGNGAPPLEQRSSERDFRQVLTKGLSSCRRNLVTVAIFSFFVNMLVLAVPIYLFNVSDRVLTSRSTDTLMMLTIIIVGALGVQVLLDMSRRFMLTRIAVEAEVKLGAPVVSAAAKAAQNGSSREFQTIGDLQHLRSFITGPVLISMLDAPVAPIYLGAVFLVHPHLGWIVTTAACALFVVAMLNQKFTAVPFGQANAFAVRANLQSDAMARNAQVINAMGMIPEAVMIWGRETAESLKAQVVAQDRNIIMSSVSKFLRLCTQIGILGWGGWLTLKGELTGGMMIAASIVGSRALAPLEGTIEGWRHFIQARAAYVRIKTLLQNSPLNLDRLRLPRPEGRLSVERILFVPQATKKVVLNGITFELEPGESLGIVGASGMGKSTLARMLVGSITPTAGAVRLDMMELRNWDARQFGESVGYLPQEVQLFPATIKANIARMRDDVTDEMIYEAAALADVHEMISQFPQGYETTIAVDGSPLSGGQKQRVALARAFFGDPRLVVLDEPNSNLDSSGEQALANALLRAKQKKITVVAVTQRPRLLQSVDKIMIMKDGAVHTLGKRDDVMPILMGNTSGSVPPPKSPNSGGPTLLER